MGRHNFCHNNQGYMVCIHKYHLNIHIDHPVAHNFPDIDIHRHIYFWVECRNLVLLRRRYQGHHRPHLTIVPNLEIKGIGLLQIQI